MHQTDINKRADAASRASTESKAKGSEGDDLYPPNPFEHTGISRASYEAWPAPEIEVSIQHSDLVQPRNPFDTALRSEDAPDGTMYNTRLNPADGIGE